MTKASPQEEWVEMRVDGPKMTDGEVREAYRLARRILAGLEFIATGGLPTPTSGVGRNVLGTVREETEELARLLGVRVDG